MFNAGFNECYNVGGHGNESGEEVLPVALDWLRRNRERDNWFLHVHFWDPHTPYRAPESFGNPFAEVPLDTWIDEAVLEEHKKAVGPHGINELGMYTDQIAPGYPRMPGSAQDMAGLRRVMDGYDTGILYADYLVGQLLDLLKEQGLYEDTAIFITSTTGRTWASWPSTRSTGRRTTPPATIPFIMKWPGCKAGSVDSGLHYSLDLLPTMAQLLGVEPWEKWDGQSFAPAVTEGKAAGREYLVLSQMAHVCQRSARFGDWIYIRTLHDGVPPL